MSTPYYPGITVTPNLGLSLIGMDDVVAQDFILIDTFAGGVSGSVEVNSVVVNNPNFVDSASAVFSVVGSNISITASGGGGFVNPMTTLGDMIYENATPAPARLVGNITATKMYLSQTGNGSISAVPVWAQVAYTDISGLSTVAHTGAYSDLTGKPQLPQTKAVVSHQFFASYDATTGLFTASQPAASDISGFSFNVPTAGSNNIPSPLFTSPETPSGVNAALFVQDVNGAWHQMAGMDTSTVMSSNQGTDTNPTNPQGILVWDRMMYFRDSQNALQTGKNAFLSINHLAGTGTSYNNQDRALWITMGNIFATISQFSIDASNNVTYVLNTLTSYAVVGAFGFKVNQRVQASGLSVGTYLNSVPLSINSVSAVSGGVQTIVCSDSGFTHAAVGPTSDSGTLNQLMYSMANIQMEQDIVGTPVFVSGVDTEVSTLSVQMADYHQGTVAAPNYGPNAMRIQYYREAGTGTWGSVHPSCIKAILTDNNDGTHGQDSMTCIAVQGNAVSGNNDIYYGIRVYAPSLRFGGGTTGLYIEDFGANASDYALKIVGGQISLAGIVTIGTLSAVTTWPTVSSSVFLAGPASGAAAPATFRALVNTDIPAFTGDGGSGGTTGGVPAPSAGQGATGYFLSAAGNWQIPSVPASSVAWNNITSPTGSLSLSLGVFTTTFQQTTNAVWLWQNTTVATNITANASPLIELAANYNSGSAGSPVSSQDTWSIGSAMTAGPSGISTLTIAHTGTTGAPQIALPTPLSNGATSPQIIGPGGTSVGVSIGAGAGVPFTVAASAGSVDIMRGYQGGTLQGGVSSQSSSGSFGLYNMLGLATAELGNAGAPANASTKPVVSLGHASSWTPTGAGPYIGINMGQSIALGGGNSLHLTWAPTQGAGSFIGAQVAPTINQTTITNNITGVNLTTNVVTVGLSGANVYAAGTIQVSAVTNTAINGSFALSSQVNRAGSPYTITNSVENSGSVVTLTIGTHAVGSGDWVFLSGLTTATWLNSQFVKVSSVVANTSITFTDPTTHGTSPTHADTGTVQDNSVTYSLTHANIAGVADTGTVFQQSTGSYTALKIAVTETLLQPSSTNKLIDCFAGASGTTEVFAVDNTGKVTEYGGVATVKAGVSSIVASTALSSQSAAISASTIYAVPAGKGGLYRISYSATITTAGTTSVLGGTNGFQSVYTSIADGQVKTSIPTTPVISAANTTGTEISGVVCAYAQASTNIQFNFGYTSTGTAMIYALEAYVEYLG